MSVKLKVVSYNIHKAVGLDRKRDPDRILSVLAELDADVIALQECDMRFGRRESVLPRARIEDSRYRPVAIETRPGSLGWHGNGFLVKKDIEIVDTAALTLPALEPRGAVRVDVRKDGRVARIVGMHLDLSGLMRREQARNVLAHLDSLSTRAPTVLAGDTNEWAGRGGVFRCFDDDWTVLDCGRSFPTRRPIARLDRMIVSKHWVVEHVGVHHSLLAARASDHLPIWAQIGLR